MYFLFSKILSPIINPINFLFVFLLITFFLYLKSNKKVFLKLFTVILSILTVIAFLPIGKLGICYLEKNYNNNQELQNIKNIIVLSGSDKRIISSIKLATELKGSKIFYVGGDSSIINKSTNYEYERAKKFYKNLNFDVNRINFISNPRNTIESIHEIKKLNLRFDETLLITSAYHMKRTMIISNKLGLSFIPYAVDFKYKSQNSLINEYQYFNISSNFALFNLFFREMLGIASFKILS